MKKTQKLKMAELTSRLIGKKYNLGQHDCLSVIIYFCDAWGITIPDEFEGYTRENYAELYNKDPEATKEVFIKFISALGKSIDPKRAAAGDFLITEYKKQKSIFIHGGRGTGISAFTDKEIDVVSLKPYKILKAYRWRAE